MSLPASRVARSSLGNIKRSPASLVLDVARIVHADRTARAPLFDRGIGRIWCRLDDTAGSGALLPLLCLEDNNYSAYSLRGQRIAPARVCGGRPCCMAGDRVN